MRPCFACWSQIRCLHVLLCSPFDPRSAEARFFPFPPSPVSTSDAWSPPTSQNASKISSTKQYWIFRLEQTIFGLSWANIVWSDVFWIRQDLSAFRWVQEGARQQCCKCFELRLRWRLQESKRFLSSNADATNSDHFIFKANAPTHTDKHSTVSWKKLYIVSKLGHAIKSNMERLTSFPRICSSVSWTSTRGRTVVKSFHQGQSFTPWFFLMFFWTQRMAKSWIWDRNWVLFI